MSLQMEECSEQNKRTNNMTYGQQAVALGLATVHLLFSSAFNHLSFAFFLHCGVFNLGPTTFLASWFATRLFVTCLVHSIRGAYSLDN